MGIYAKYIKRILDFLFSLCALIVLSPFLLLLLLIGAVAMKGNPVFTQARPGKIGKDGKEKIFKMIKFRTMTNERDAEGNLLPDERRLTAYGRFLRASSCDELLEILNVLKGDMSIVGPRPLLPEYLPYYSERQRHRHDVLPGLTGLAQIHGRNDISWDEKFEWDLRYVNHITFLSDCKIIQETVKTVVKRDGIHSATSATMESFIDYCRQKTAANKEFAK